MKTTLLWKGREKSAISLTPIILAFILIIMSSAVKAQVVIRDNCLDPLGTPGITMDPSLVPMFVNDLPVISELGLRIDATLGGNFNMKMEETAQDLLGLGINTKVWGYGLSNGTVTYPGPTFVAMRDVPITATFFNNLPGHFLPVDPTMHMAHPSTIHGATKVREWYESGNVPTVPHLHGGHTESASDGLPEAWYTQNFMDVGAQYVKQKLTYHNDQEAGTLWYHDHAL